jgi:hypothetical protein
MYTKSAMGPNGTAKAEINVKMSWAACDSE